MRMKDQSMKWLSILFMVAMFLGSGARAEDNQGVFPYTVTEDTRDRELSAAMHRSFYHYPAPRLEDNELYSQFKYTPLEGFDYKNGDGTVSRRDPTKVIFENGKYYVWYTRRSTPTVPQGAKGYTDTIPSTDWDLAEIW
jgi:hypothetical protein